MAPMLQCSNGPNGFPAVPSSATSAHLAKHRVACLYRADTQEPLPAKQIGSTCIGLEIAMSADLIISVQ